MDSVKDRLRLVESEFIVALSKGEDALAAFDSRFQGLLQDVERLAQSSSLDDECAMLVHTTSMRISILADTSVDLYSACDTAFSQLVDELDTMVSHLTIQDAPRDSVSVLEPQSSQSTQIHPPAPPCEPIRCKRRRGSDPCIELAVRAKRPRMASSQIGCNYPPSSMVSRRRNAPTSKDPQDWASDRPVASPSLRSPKRKRRLSDAGTEPPSMKRMYTGPRLHAVSDSFVTPRHSQSPSQHLVSQQGCPQLLLEHLKDVSPSSCSAGGIDIQPLIQQASLPLYSISDPFQAISESSHAELPISVPELDDFNLLFEDLLASYDAVPLPMSFGSDVVPGDSSVAGEDSVWDWPSPSVETSSDSSSSSSSPISTPSGPLSPMLFFHGIDLETVRPAAVRPVVESSCTSPTSRLQLNDPSYSPPLEPEGKYSVDTLWSITPHSAVPDGFLCPISDPLEPIEWLRLSPCPHMNPTAMSALWSTECPACAPRTEWPILVAGDAASNALSTMDSNSSLQRCI